MTGLYWLAPERLRGSLWHRRSCGTLHTLRSFHAPPERLMQPASPHSAQSNPRHSCPLYVSISIHLKDHSRMAALSASIGAGPRGRGERQSFRILQNLSLSVTPNWWFGSAHAKRG